MCLRVETPTVDGNGGPEGRKKKYPLKKPGRKKAPKCGSGCWVTSDGINIVFVIAGTADASGLDRLGFLPTETPERRLTAGTFFLFVALCN